MYCRLGLIPAFQNEQMLVHSALTKTFETDEQAEAKKNSTETIQISDLWIFKLYGNLLHLWNQKWLPEDGMFIRNSEPELAEILSCLLMALPKRACSVSLTRPSKQKTLPAKMLASRVSSMIQRNNCSPSFKTFSIPLKQRIQDLHWCWDIATNHAITGKWDWKQLYSLWWNKW